MVSGIPVKSGEYWIDPENNGNPFKVFCDMSTKGGTCEWVRTTVKNADGNRHLLNKNLGHLMQK